MPARNVEFHVLSFQNTRITRVASALAARRFDTHVWSVGDPSLPGHQSIGHLHLHRWDVNDYSRSLPPAVAAEITAAVADDCDVLVLADQPQMVDTVRRLEHLLGEERLRDRVSILWHAQDTFDLARLETSREANRDAASRTPSLFSCAR